MSILRQMVVGGLGIAASIALVAPAAAATYYTTTSTAYNYNLTPGGYSLANGLTTTVSGLGIKLTASAWNATKGTTNYTFAKQTLAQYSGGLAVVGTSTTDSPSGCGGIGGCNQHEIDNLGSAKNSTSIDFIRLDFTQAVVLGGFGQTVYPMLYADERKDKYGNFLYQYDDDYSVGVMTAAGNKTDVVAGMTGVSNLATIFGRNDPNSTSCVATNNNPCTDTALVYTKAQAGAVTASKTWYIAASILADYGGDKNPDGFKLANLTVYYNTKTPHQSAVPEPSSWMTMIAGFGVAGVALRRTRRQKSATVTA